MKRMQAALRTAKEARRSLKAALRELTAAMEEDEEEEEEKAEEEEEEEELQPQPGVGGNRYDRRLMQQLLRAQHAEIAEQVHEEVQEEMQEVSCLVPKAHQCAWTTP